GESITSTVSGGVATILEGALREMAIIKVSKFALAVVLLFSFVSTGVGIIVGQASSAPDNTGQVKEDSPLLAEKPEQGKKVEPEAVLQPVLVAGGDKLPLDQDAEKFMKDYLQSLKDLAVVLKTIKDSASAEAAVPKVEEAVKRLVAAEGKALRNNPTKDPVIGKKYNEVREKYASELQEVKTATYREIDRFYGAPELQKILLASTEWAKLDAVSEKNGISEKNWPTFVQGWRALKITDKDDAVTKLLKERYNAVQVELRGRYIMWMQDAESLGMVYDAARRLTQAQMEVGGEGSDAVTVLKEKVAWAYVVERQAVNVQKKFNNSKHASDLESARYFRADAELELLRAEKAAQEKKGK
ncbi:MAG TPA: hypothetical protein VE988_04305, partial [Gemmataceae bacterium]|nr:hypothetical protein [Gemmataceae bacterium]